MCVEYILRHMRIVCIVRTYANVSIRSLVSLALELVLVATTKRRNGDREACTHARVNARNEYECLCVVVVTVVVGVAIAARVM